MTKPRRFQLIDLDRTIFDTSRFAKAITDEIDKIEPGVGVEFDRKFEEAYEKKTTFFLLRYLRETRGDTWFEQTVERVVSQMGANSLYLAGVSERLARVDEYSSLRPSWGIITYGDDIDQRLKAQLIGLDTVPFFLADVVEKGYIAASWQQPDGTFRLPEVFGGGIADEVTLEDDKLIAFAGLPEHAYGFWVTPLEADEAQAAIDDAVQRGEIPARVQAVRHIGETMNFLE